MLFKWIEKKTRKKKHILTGKWFIDLTRTYNLDDWKKKCATVTAEGKYSMWKWINKQNIFRALTNNLIRATTKKIVFEKKKKNKPNQSEKNK